MDPRIANFWLLFDGFKQIFSKNEDFFLFLKNHQTHDRTQIL